MGASTDATSLSANELRRVVTGKTVYLDISGFELPIHYLENGRMSGSIGTIAATLSWGDVASDNGRWWRDQPALPAVDELVGRPNLLLQAHSPR
jgi:hypothetical protein